MITHALLLAAFLDSASAIRHIVTAPAETLGVHIQGNGSDVVVIPGLVGGAFGWRRVSAELAASGLRILVIEPLGTGMSARPRQADYSLTAQAGRVAAVLDSLGVHHAVVVSHSLGSSIAFRLALARPDLVASLLNVEGGAAEQATTAGFRRALKLAPLLKLLGGKKRLRGQIGKGIRESSGNADWVTEEVVEGYTADATRDLSSTLDAFSGMARAREPYCLADSLASLALPVHLLHGGSPHPGSVNPEELQRLRRLLPNLSEQSVEGAGHYIHEERPEVVIEAILRAVSTAHDPLTARVVER